MEVMLVPLALAFLTIPVFALIIAIVALNRARENAARLDNLTRELERLRPFEVPTAPTPTPIPTPAREAPLPQPVRSAPPPSPPERVAPSPQLPALSPPSRAPERAVDLEQIVGGRWTTWAGAIALLFGVGFLLRWSFQNNLIGPGARVMLGLGAGLALLAGGSYLRRRPALVVLCDGLTGAGLGMLYLALFAAHRVYGFLDAGPAFAAMAGVTVLGVAVSVATSRQPVAILAVLGGLLTPILVTTTRPDERVLLGYLFVLDLVVLGVARFRSWPWLTRLAWGGSAVLMLPAILASGSPPHAGMRLYLMSALFLLFLAVPLIRPWLERVAADRLDLALVVGNPVLFFGGVYLTLERSGKAEGPPAIWAAFLGLVYLYVAQYHAERIPGGDPPFTSIQRAIGATFLAIAAPLALDGPWVTLAWAVLGIGFVMLSERPGRGALDLGLGAALLAGAVLRAVYFDPYWYPVKVAVWNVRFAVHAAVVTAVAFAGARAGRSTAIPNAGPMRSFAWFVASGLAAVLLWRDPPVPWPALLLAAELIALAVVARAKPDFAFAIATPAVGAILLLRLFVEDGEIAWDAAVELVNPQLGLRLGACAAIAVAAWLLKPLSDRPAFRTACRSLAAAWPFILWVTLSYAWWARQQQLARLEAGDAARRLRWLQQVGLSVLWTIYAAAALAVGFLRRLPAARYAALTLLGFTILKVFLVDLSALNAIYRIVSFIVLGVVLLAIAFVYQRRARPA